jgi:hypothetical protein
VNPCFNLTVKLMSGAWIQLIQPSVSGEATAAKPAMDAVPHYAGSTAMPPAGVDALPCSQLLTTNHNEMQSNLKPGRSIAPTNGLMPPAYRYVVKLFSRDLPYKTPVKRTETPNKH